MSERAFAAAIWPNIYGSSTIGGKKSSVCIIATSSLILYTAASSPVSRPTSTRSFSNFGSLPRIFASVPGPIFAAQPDALAYFVICIVSFISLLRSAAISAAALRSDCRETSCLTRDILCGIHPDIPCRAPPRSPHPTIASISIIAFSNTASASSTGFPVVRSTPAFLRRLTGSSVQPLLRNERYRSTIG